MHPSARVRHLLGEVGTGLWHNETKMSFPAGHCSTQRVTGEWDVFKPKQGSSPNSFST